MLWGFHATNKEIIRRHLKIHSKVTSPSWKKVCVQTKWSSAVCSSLWVTFLSNVNRRCQCLPNPAGIYSEWRRWKLTLKGWIWRQQYNFRNTTQKITMTNAWHGRCGEICSANRSFVNETVHHPWTWACLQALQSSVQGCITGLKCVSVNLRCDVTLQSGAKWENAQDIVLSQRPGW